MSDMKHEKLKTHKSLDDDELVIEDNTIYEVDLDCYECLRRERKKLKTEESE